MNFQAEHVEALRQLGYVEREAEFLCIVAVHSGFFVLRQFIQYADVAGRGPITISCEKPYKGNTSESICPNAAPRRSINGFPAIRTRQSRKSILAIEEPEAMDCWTKHRSSCSVWILSWPT